MRSVFSITVSAKVLLIVCNRKVFLVLNFKLCVQKEWGLPNGSVVKNPPAVQETGVRSLGREDPSEESMATHSSILAWGVNPVDRGAWRAAVHGVTKSWTRLSEQQQR